MPGRACSHQGTACLRFGIGPACRSTAAAARTGCAGGCSSGTCCSSVAAAAAVAGDTAAHTAAAFVAALRRRYRRPGSSPWACRRHRVCSAQPADGGGYSSCRRGLSLDTDSTQRLLSLRASGRDTVRRGVASRRIGAPRGINDGPERPVRKRKSSSRKGFDATRCWRKLLRRGNKSPDSRAGQSARLSRGARVATGIRRRRGCGEKDTTRKDTTRR